VDEKEQKIRYAIQKAIKEMNSKPSEESVDLFEKVTTLIKEQKLNHEQQAALIGKLLDWDLNK
tara:strand:- start:219 stop:407 length:189 start_codon:yes stop_codon:yes gene_type:complete